MEWGSGLVAAIRQLRAGRTSPRPSPPNYEPQTVSMLSLTSTAMVDVTFRLRRRPVDDEIDIEGMRIGSVVEGGIQELFLKTIVCGNYDALLFNGRVDFILDLVKTIMVMDDYRHIPIVAVIDPAEVSKMRKLKKAGVKAIFPEVEDQEFMFKHIVKLIAKPSAEKWRPSVGK